MDCEGADCVGEVHGGGVHEHVKQRRQHMRRVWRVNRPGAFEVLVAKCGLGFPNSDKGWTR